MVGIQLSEVNRLSSFISAVLDTDLCFVVLNPEKKGRRLLLLQAFRAYGLGIQRLRRWFRN